MEKENGHSEGTDIFTILIRFIGIFVLLLGLWIGYQVISEAWKLFRSPVMIENFSQKIEEGSRINQFAESLCKFSREVVSETVKKMPQVPDNKMESKELPAITPFNLSYFVSWGIVIMLLLVIGKIACWIIGAGGKMAVHSGNTEKIARAMVRQMIIEMDLRKQS